MKRLLIASLVVVSLLLLASGAMADYGDRHGDDCPPVEPCPPKEVCPPIVICFPEMPMCDIDVCFPELPCGPNVIIEDFPEICCPEIDCDFPEICCPAEEPCPAPAPCPDDDKCDDDKGKDNRHNNHRR